MSKCSESQKQKMKEYYLKNKEQFQKRKSEWYQQNKEKYCKKIMKFYWKNHDRIRKQQNERKRERTRTDPEFRERMRQHGRDMYRKHLAYYTLRNSKNAKTLEQKARMKLVNAVLRGKIKRPKKCDACGSENRIQAHHHRGYHKPFDVLWLCVPCHALVHK